jgi:5'-phosphate synthase pdxT subunit
MTVTLPVLTIGVLALQGAFSEHIQLLRQASESLKARHGSDLKFSFTEVRTPEQLEACDALIIPGGESTTISLVAARSGLLEPLREFVKYVSSVSDFSRTCDIS